MPIPQFIGQVPSRDDPANFSERAEALFDWMVNEMVPGANNLEGSLTLVGSTGASTTSMTVGTGARSLTTQPSKNWIAGAYVYVVSASAVGNAMLGQVTAYNAETGALSIDVVSTTGSGTHSAWIIGLSVPMFPIQASQLAAGAAVGNIGYTPADAAALAGKAELAGNSAQAFAVAAATSDEHATPRSQVLSLISANGLGGGQTWQDVSGSRSLGTTYTNTTGRPIALSVRTSPVNNSFVNVTVGGVLIARRWGGETWAPEIPIFGIVPPGATYVVTGSNALQSWCELR